MVLELKFAGENDQMSLKNLWLHALLCVCVCVCVCVYVWLYGRVLCGRNKSRRTPQRTELEHHTSFLEILVIKLILLIIRMINIHALIS